jgi:hypothetical protein
MIYYSASNNATKNCDSDEWYWHYPTYLAQDYNGHFHLHGHMFGHNYPYNANWGVRDDTLPYPYMVPTGVTACVGVPPAESNYWYGWRPNVVWNPDYLAMYVYMIFEIKITYSAGVFSGISWAIFSEFDTSRLLTGADHPDSFGKSMCVDYSNNVYTAYRRDKSKWNRGVGLGIVQKLNGVNGARMWMVQLGDDTNNVEPTGMTMNDVTNKLLISGYNVFWTGSREV